MSYKDPDKQKDYLARHYLANKVAYLDRSNRSQERRKDLLREAKAVPCADCGRTYPYYVMDFDHRDPSTKRFSLSSGVKTHGTAEVLAEMEKCDVVCANCHRERTHSSKRSQQAL